MRVPLTLRRSLSASVALGAALSVALLGGRADAVPFPAAPLQAALLLRAGLPLRAMQPVRLVVPFGRAWVSPTAQPVLAAATSALGTPYRWGGASPGGFDCSGFTRWAWSQAGVALPHSSAAQRGATTPVGGADLQPGDLVFYGAPVSHVAMYLGDGMIIHSPRSGDVVKVAPLGQGVGKPLVGFGRVK